MKKLLPLLSVLFLISWGCDSKSKNLPIHENWINYRDIYERTVKINDNEVILHEDEDGHPLSGVVYKGNKDLFVVVLINGFRHGLYIHTDRYNRVHEMGNYHYGLKEGYFRTDSDGILESESYYKYGKKDSLYTQYWGNGNKVREGMYEDGIQEGVWKSWYQNGQIESEVTFLNGKPIGEMKNFDSTGTSIQILDCDNQDCDSLVPWSDLYWNKISNEIFEENLTELGKKLLSDTTFLKIRERVQKQIQNDLGKKN